MVNRRLSKVPVGGMWATRVVVHGPSRGTDNIVTVHSPSRVVNGTRACLTPRNTFRPSEHVWYFFHVRCLTTASMSISLVRSQGRSANTLHHGPTAAGRMRSRGAATVPGRRRPWTARGRPPRPVRPQSAHDAYEDRIHISFREGEGRMATSDAQKYKKAVGEVRELRVRQVQKSVILVEKSG